MLALADAAGAAEMRGGDLMDVAASLTPHEAAGRPWDALVVGAGPAGSTAARLLAQQRRRVLIIDKSRFPREKACGGCLNHAAAAQLQRMGLASALAGALPLDEFCLRDRRRSIRLRVPRSWAISRKHLDARLLRAAISAGAAFLPECQARRLSAIREGHAHRSVGALSNGEPLELAASVVLDCAGIADALLDDEPECRWQIADDAWIGLATTLSADNNTLPGVIWMSLTPAGYVGAVRLADGCTHLAAALPPRLCQHRRPVDLMQQILDDSGMGHPPLDGSRLYGTAPLTRHRRIVGSWRVLAAGDACGYVEPFTGQGIAWAMASAEAVVGLLPESLGSWPADLPQRWTQRYRRFIRPRQRICRALRLLIHHDPLGSLAMRTARLFPSLAQQLAWKMDDADSQGDRR